MEQELQAKLGEVEESIKEKTQGNKKVTGVAIVDRMGLPIDIKGDFKPEASGLISSIVKNCDAIEGILVKAGGEEP